MKTALITTTINIPSVLALYRRFDPIASVRFFVAIDQKTPPDAIAFCDTLGNVEVIHYTAHTCDRIIGDNSIQRRNLALLEAVRWGADVIVSVDDDNIPLDPNYFLKFESLFTWPESNLHYGRTRPFSGLLAGGNEWFDVGTLLNPPATHRGFPIGRAGWAEFKGVIDARIGVAAGICLGDPDTSAANRIANRPNVHGVSEVLKAGLVVSPATHTVFNSQNTAIIRELAPAWSMWCGVSRYDDILASLMVQRVMRDRDYHVYFGRPFVYQQRNDHDLTKDLQHEMWGMQNLVKIAAEMDRIPLSGTSVIDDTRDVFLGLEQWLPANTVAAGLAFLEDCEKVL